MGAVIDGIMAELGFAADDPLIDQIHGEIQDDFRATPQITRKEIQKLWNHMNRGTTARAAKRTRK